VVTITEPNLASIFTSRRRSPIERVQMRNSKKDRKSKPSRHSITHKTLRRKMSEVISLRERVAQAELDVGVARLRQIGRTENR
jgi:hypothetical protein